MKKLTVILFAGIFLSGCISTKKFKSIVDSKTMAAYENNSPADLNDFIQVKVSAAVLEQFSDTKIEQASSYFIPAIFYWGLKNSFNCSLQNHFMLNTFKNTIRLKAHEYNAKRFFPDRTLEIEIEKLPLQFTYMYYENVIFYIYGASTISNRYIQMQDDSKMIVNYRIWKDNKIQKAETLTINFNTGAAHPAYSDKKLINLFLDNLTADYNFAAEWIIDRIIEDL